MRDINTLLDEFSFVANHPRAVMDRYLAEGKRVIGCFPVYTPQPIVTALGMVPMGLWGGQVTPMVAGKYNPIYTCSIMRSCLEYGMTGVYRGLSGVLMPILCDTFRGMSSAWRAGVKEIPLIAFIHPQNRKDPGALAFLTEEYRSVRAQLERLAGRILSETDLDQALELYNSRNEAMREFTKLACSHLDLITPTVRHNVMKSATFLEVRESTALLKELNLLLGQRPRYHWTGKKAVLTGITAEPAELLEILAENRIAVVADDLAQESRQCRTDYPQGTDSMERLAAQWLAIQGCSMAYEPDCHARGNLLLNLAKENGADCIIFCLMRFCDIEEYDFPYLSQMAENAGLYVLHLEIDQSTQDNGQSKTKVQSYAEL